MAETHRGITRLINKSIDQGIAMVIAHPLYCEHPTRVTMAANIHGWRHSVGD